MQDVYRKPAELPRERTEAAVAVVAPAPAVATMRADEADAMSFVREGPYDPSAADAERVAPRWAVVMLAALTTIFSVAVFVLTRP